MPPTTSIVTFPTNLVPQATAEVEEKIWTQVLSEVSAKSSNTLQGGSVIILGDNKSGKSSLLTSLDQSLAESYASALEYHILKVQNNDSSYAYQLGTAAGGLGTAENLILPVWTVDGEECFAPLINYALPSGSPSRSVALICGSIDSPGLVHSLKRWANLLTRQVNEKYDKNTLKEAMKQQEKYWQEYVEPVECSMTTSMVTGIEESGLLPVENGVLVENSGTNMVIVITKSDLSISDQTADRIMVQIRQLCLKLGAALVYTSSKTLKNTKLLYKYIVHRAFGLPFTSPAQVIERDSIFVPAGWDGQKKIDIIKDGISNVDEPLEPTREKAIIHREQVIEAEDEQAFLQRLAQMDAGAPAPVKKPALMDDATDSNSPLASFFSNLLKDKAASSSLSPRSSAPTSQQEAQVQLERIIKETKETTTASESSS